MVRMHYLDRFCTGAPARQLRSVYSHEILTGKPFVRKADYLDMWLASILGE
jgi:hypothetical protein